MKKDNILKHAYFLIAITALVGLIDFIYNIAMSRMLTVPDFGDLRSLFSIIMIFAVPTVAVQTMMAKFTAEFYQTSLGRLKSLSMHVLAAIAVLGCISIVVFWSFRYFISGYLRISSANLVALLGPLVLLIFTQSIMLGIYQGMQRFVLLGLSNLTAAILKLILGAFLVYSGFAIFGALGGLIFSRAVLILILGFMLAFLFRKDAGLMDPYNRQDIYTYSGYALGVLVCFSVISQIDILIVKHRFLPQDAGIYACAAVIGKAFLFLPIPIVTVLFPKVVERNRADKGSLSILIQALIISLVLCIMGVITCFAFPHYLIKIFGAKYAPAVHLIGVFGLAMSPFALFYVVMNYFLSEYRLKFFYYCLSVCLAGIIILSSLPKTLTQFISVMGWFGLLIFILPLIYIIKREKTSVYSAE